MRLADGLRSASLPCAMRMTHGTALVGRAASEWMSDRAESGMFTELAIPR